MRCTAVGLLHQFEYNAAVLRAADVRVAGARRIVGLHGIHNEPILSDAKLTEFLDHFSRALVAEFAVAWVDLALVEFVGVGVPDNAEFPGRVVLQQIREALDGHFAGAGWAALQERVVNGRTGHHLIS